MNTTATKKDERMEFYPLKAPPSMVKLTQTLWPKGERAAAIRRGWKREIQRELKERGLLGD